MDRRWSARKHPPLDVMLEIPQCAEPVRAGLRDLSLSGAFVRTDFLLPFARLVMVFKMPGVSMPEGFRLDARVVRRTAGGSGLMFQRTPPGVIRALSCELSRYH